MFKKFLMILLVITSFNANASYDLVCSGVDHFSSPYPGAGGKIESFFRAKLDRRSAKLSHGRDFRSDFTVEHVNRDQESGEVEILGSDREGTPVEITISVLGSAGPKFYGRFGNKSIDFKCNRNLIVGL